MTEAVNAFLLGLPALFSIVNPISGAFIFGSVTEDRATEERANMARKVAIYSFVVMMVALWAGAVVLAFFGITLAALRVAGGVVVALTAWELLNRPEHREARKQEQALPASEADDIAFFPMTIPITTGPGTMAVAVALSASRPRATEVFAWFVLGMSAAAVALALTIASRD
jgi:multiple antibiotic resistance protein